METKKGRHTGVADQHVNSSLQVTMYPYRAWLLLGHGSTNKGDGFQSPLKQPQHRQKQAAACALSGSLQLAAGGFGLL